MTPEEIALLLLKGAVALLPSLADLIRPELAPEPLAAKVRAILPETSATERALNDLTSP